MTIAAILVFALTLVVIGVVVYAIALYNGLVSVKHQVDQAWANIDVLLRQRHDELPKLIDIVKAHGAYERELLESVTALRTRAAIGQGPDAARLSGEDTLSRAVTRLLATAESYPDLKASASYLELQRRVSALEEQIGHRREFYNAAVNLNNVRLEQFPESLFAAAAGLTRRPLFSVAAEQAGGIATGAISKT
jgi:LemA protein